MHDVTTFQYNTHPIRSILVDNEPWFVARDVCDVLGLGNTTKALYGLDDEDLTLLKVKSGGQHREMRLVSEPGLYHLIFKSRTAAAKEFKRWVTHEVIPAIRKTGSYSAPAGNPYADESNLPETLTPVVREFTSSVRLARLAGLAGNAAILSANVLTRKITGHDPLALIGQTHLINEAQQQHYNPTEIGVQLGGLSGQKVNKLLVELGLQKKVKIGKKKHQYKPTRKGKEYAVVIDSGRRHSDGSMIQQVRWNEDVLIIMREALA